MKRQGSDVWHILAENFKIIEHINLKRKSNQKRKKIWLLFLFY